jgi:hypothetical protein
MQCTQLQACLQEGRDEQKRLHHKMSQHLKYPKKMSHLKGTAARIEF